MDYADLEQDQRELIDSIRENIAQLPLVEDVNDWEVLVAEHGEI